MFTPDQLAVQQELRDFDSLFQPLLDLHEQIERKWRAATSIFECNRYSQSPSPSPREILEQDAEYVALTSEYNTKLSAFNTVCQRLCVYAQKWSADSHELLKAYLKDSSGGPQTIVWRENEPRFVMQAYSHLKARATKEIPTLVKSRSRNPFDPVDIYQEIESLRKWLDWIHTVVGVSERYFHVETEDAEESANRKDWMMNIKVLCAICFQVLERWGMDGKEHIVRWLSRPCASDIRFQDVLDKLKVRAEIECLRFVDRDDTLTEDDYVPIEWQTVVDPISGVPCPIPSKVVRRSTSATVDDIPMNGHPAVNDSPQNGETPKSAHAKPVFGGEWAEVAKRESFWTIAKDSELKHADLQPATTPEARNAFKPKDSSIPTWVSLRDAAKQLKVKDEHFDAFEKRCHRLREGSPMDTNLYKESVVRSRNEPKYLYNLARLREVAIRLTVE